MSDDNYAKLNKIRTALYGESNLVPLDDENLISVILTFPAAMVAAIDGNVDETERLFLLNISENLGSDDPGTSHTARLEAAERYRAFMWLLCEKDTYEKDIFDGIKFLINVFCKHRACKKIISRYIEETLYLLCVQINS